MHKTTCNCLNACPQFVFAAYCTKEDAGAAMTADIYILLATDLVPAECSALHQNTKNTCLHSMHMFWKEYKAAELTSPVMLPALHGYCPHSESPPLLCSNWRIKPCPCTARHATLGPPWCIQSERAHETGNCRWRSFQQPHMLAAQASSPVLVRGYMLRQGLHGVLNLHPLM